MESLQFDVKEARFDSEDIYLDLKSVRPVQKRVQFGVKSVHFDIKFVYVDWNTVQQQTISKGRAAIYKLPAPRFEENCGWEPRRNNRSSLVTAFS